MASNKLSVAFRPLNEADFQVRYGIILDSVTNNPRLPEPWHGSVPGSAQLRAEADDYRELQQAVQRRDFGQVDKRDQARERLTRSLQRLAGFVELVANGEQEVLESSGFEIRRDPGRTAGSSSGGSSALRINPPEGFRVGRGPHTGSLEVDASPQRGAIAYEIQITRGDPSQEEGWKQALIVPKVRHLLIDKLPAGVTWVRLRAVGVNGEVGPWTSPISVIVG
jgi:hypothetical protein